MRRWAAAALLLICACGPAQFSPDCRRPSAGELANPIAIAPRPQGGFVVANADSAELFCGGFLQAYTADGAPDGDPWLVETEDGYAANFSSLAATKRRLWLVDRRFGGLVAMAFDGGEQQRIIKDRRLDRVFRLGPERVGVTRFNIAAELRVVREDGTFAGAITDPSGAAPIAAVTDASRGLFWLATNGGRNVTAYDLGRLVSVRRDFPLGLQERYRLRGIARIGDVLWASDFRRGVVFSWRAADGAPLEAVRFDGTPEAVRTAAGRVWVLQANGAVHVRRTDGVWRTSPQRLERPVDLLPDAEGAWVVDFGGDAVVRVAVP